MRRVDPPRAAAAILAARTSPSRTLRRLLDLPPPPPALALVFLSDGGKIRSSPRPRPRRPPRRGREDAPPRRPASPFPSPSSFPPSRRRRLAPPLPRRRAVLVVLAQSRRRSRAHLRGRHRRAAPIRRERPRHPLAVVRQLLAEQLARRSSRSKCFAARCGARTSTGTTRCAPSPCSWCARASPR